MVLGAWILALAAQAAQAPEPRPGTWRAWLDSPGGELRFELAIERSLHGTRAHLVNGSEEILVGVVRQADGSLVLGMPVYDSRIECRVSQDGARIDGEWSKRSGPERWTRLGFHAEHTGPHVHPHELEPAAPAPVDGRWAVSFAESEDPAVGLFSTGPEAPDGVRQARGTFLTTLGDYRFLAGSWTEGRLELACFDGAHAFLFRAELAPDGSLAGDFWSGDRWHARWTARADPQARLPDPFGLTSWNQDTSLMDLRFPDGKGNLRALGEPTFAGRARILQLFGSWCPNCNDEAPFLVELDRRYRSRGLSIVGLAFELTGDSQRDFEQVQRYAERHGISFPILLAGTADKGKASERFPLIDRVRAFPTTVFLRRDGSVRAVHTGFAGPAAGAEHDKLRADFERLIEELLADEPSGGR